MPKKILYVFDKVVHYQRELFQELDRRLTSNGDELHLMSGIVSSSSTGRVGLKDKVIENETKYTYYEYHLKGFTFRRQKGVIEHIKKIKPDIVVVMSHVGNITYWRLMGLKKPLGFKLVSWQCGYEFNPGKIKNWILSKFIPGFDYHLAYHTNAKKYAITHGAHENTITVIHNTINEKKVISMPKNEARIALEKKHPELTNKKLVLYVGAILKEKKLDTLIDAVSSLNRQDIVTVIVGDGPYMNELRSFCDDKERVILTGNIVDGVGVYFDAADCFVLPGTGGLAINEAMMHSTPVISGYADGSADDLVNHGITGYRLTLGTLNELAERITNIIDFPDKGKNMGDKARESIYGEYSFNNLINRIMNGLNSID
jgi:glycosyltransferase involved in cell wall biosynthesis